MRKALPALLLLAACGVEAPQKRSPELATLCEDYWQFLMRESPRWATYLGDHRYDDRLEDIGPEGRARTRRETEGLLQQVRALPPGGTTDAITLDILRHQLEIDLARHEHKLWQWDVDQMDGPQVWLFELPNWQRMDAAFVKRLEAFPRHVDQYAENLREGMREGRVATRFAVDRVVQQLRSHLAKPAAEWPVAKAGPEPVERWVKPAFEKLLAFFEKEYRPRDAVGLGALPGGEAAYRYLIRRHTTKEMTPKELHDIGLSELALIEAEMRAIAKTNDLREYRTRLMRDRGNFPASREEYLEGFRAILRKVDERLPRYFALLPLAHYEVRAIEDFREKDAPAAYYYGPPEDGSRPGIFYANCWKPEARPLFNMAALAVHEAVPGHHLQIAFARERKDLPTFRRHSGSTAFVEGWALYAERLADEMGVYGTDLERYGMLTYQAWRAARLVVDTGLHAMGWSRDQAIDFFKQHLALTETEILIEIDRYIIWPGQALAYKVGQREIQALRARAEKELGTQFDLSLFHLEVLRHGAVPLPTLAMLVERWIPTRK